LKAKVITDFSEKGLFPEETDMLREVAEVHFGPFTHEDFLKEVKDADAIFLALKKIDEEILDAAPKLKIVARYGVGYDNVDVEACTKRGVYVTITPGVLSDAVADLALAFMLCLSRNIIEADKYTREKWARNEDKLRLGFDLKGKVCGIVGLGRIGFQVAKRVHGFGMRILYYDIVRNEEAERLFGAKLVSLDELLRESDYVTIHVFLNEKTRGMIGRRELSLMKKSAYIINTARGAVIDQTALVEFLKEKKIAGAGLDVFEKEPISLDDPLLKLDNVVLAPHMGSATVETRRAMARTAIKNIMAVLKGEVPPNPVPEQRGKVFQKS